MFKKFYLKTDGENYLKVKGMLIEKYQGIVGCSGVHSSTRHEWILNVGPFKYKHFKQDLDRAMKMGIITEVEEL